MSELSTLRHSALESERFGLRISRAEMDDLEEKRLVGQIIADSVDVAIIRLPAGLRTASSRLSRHGLPTLHADTLVYYTLDLGTHVPRALRNQDLAFSIATITDAAELQALVETTFVGYTSHYHANPNFPAERILAGYLEWAGGYIDTSSTDRITWVARRHGAIVAFACCKFNEHASTCEGVLYGVHPAHAGGGLYGDLIRHTQSEFKARGFGKMEVSTQVWNYAVQKVWAREGFVLARALDTFHVNAMLSAADRIVEREVLFSNDQVERFALASGDTNPLHLDDAKARAAGFEGRITHGMLAGAELSRIFGTEVPGAGTLYLRANMTFLRPVLAGQAHRLRILYRSSPGSRTTQAVATITDAHGRACVLAYNDLLANR
ncbi:bifunctional GNAT family N-acetyltransferase/hotdog fold thioesterase [Thermomonas sp.]|uniref:bifunctional GNAT family N-acetyltransferase/hotdog fold thioesterase n=1 Tax=Thermomonas sp. TaxID=1971895 RepID=UPI00248A5519|nr:bifunctional GNAT family N-acetyltransferase/hotdog fold thioesterase [Thermomonas sp.]MDI1254209.1 bifunctional GNAT family N-acetyltransferase/hotdog fold thioesterase [Thermomonas sp.]